MRTRLVFLLAVIGSLSTFYILNLTQFVQGGDTGELVAASYRLLVAHPPGYPLWIWLEYFFTHFLPWSTVFWRASLLSEIFACCALVLMGLPSTKTPTSPITYWVALLCIPLLALSKPFIDAALLPDVFSLQILLVVAIGSIFLFSTPEDKVFVYAIPLLFGLGLAHHLTILFLVPVLLGSFYKAKLKPMLLSLCAGMCLTALFYLSLFLFHPQGEFSWGNLRTLGDLLHHILRSDYGTFRLAATDQRSGFEFKPGGLLFFFQSCWLELIGLLGVISFAVFNKADFLKNSKARIWLSSIALSLLFFLFANVVPVGMGREVLSRFCLMPLAQITLLALYLINQTRLNSRVCSVLVVLLGVIVSIQGVRAFQYANIKNDSVIEDYSLNLLKLAGANVPAVIISENENAYFGMRYIQAVLQDSSSSSKVLVTTPALFLHSWYLEKLQNVAPQIQLYDSDRVWSDRLVNIQSNIILPNISKFSIFVQKGYQDGKSFHVRFLGLGRILSPGEDLEFDYGSTNVVKLRTTYIKPPGGPQGYSRALLYSEYSFYDLMSGIVNSTAGNKSAAITSWQSALKKVPYAFPALINLCKLQNNSNSAYSQCNEHHLQEVKLESEGFF